MSRLSTDTRDQAIAIAKKWGHEEVELRHLLVALASELDATENLNADQLLQPRGSAVSPPHVSDAVEALLSQCTSRESAIECLRDLEEEFQLEGPIAPASAASDEESPANQRAEETAGMPDRDLSEVIEELNQLIGLGSVKAAVSDLAHLHRMNRAREAEGLPPMPVGLNLVFTGSPGTGKTTVARLVAELYKALGLLPRGHLVEVHRADLVAGYVGQTAIQVEKVVDRARGGVLFIDEAYALASSGQNDYGVEAIATLVKLMEDNRNDLAVITAGYQKPMAAFIRSNPGLESRFQRFINFPDYNEQELSDIFSLMASQYELELTDAAHTRLAQVIRNANENARRGNARFVRNLLESAYARMAARAASDGVIEREELSTLEPPDIPEPVQPDDATHDQYL